MASTKKRTKAEFERFLNALYTPAEASYYGIQFAEGARLLLTKARFGTALRRHDPARFELGYRAWLDDRLTPSWKFL